jgi:hypothetical protein
MKLTTRAGRIGFVDLKNGKKRQDSAVGFPVLIETC